MKLDNLIFWVSPLSHELYVGTALKRDSHTAGSKRQITGLMMHGIVEVMRTAGKPQIELEQDGKRYRLQLEEVVSNHHETSGEQG